MQMTEEGLALIRRFEGFRGRAYRCPAGVWTIGYGHTSQAGPPVVRPCMEIGEVEARRILARDVDRFAREVAPLLRQPVTDAQFSALVSFAFNVGTGAFRSSSVLKAVNAGRFQDVPVRLKLWVKAGGHVLQGLERRRAAEAELFLSDTPPQAGRGVTGVPKSVAVESELGRAGAVLGGGAAAAGAAGVLPDWALVLLLVALVTGAALFLLWRWRRRAATEVAR
jgi:lysozyme